jgi:hypothetical protein
MDAATGSIGRILTISALIASLLAACATTGFDQSIPESELTPNQIALRKREEALNTTVWEGAALGALIGGLTGVLASKDNRAIGGVAGAAGGGALGALAGNYVAGRQREAGDRLEALELMVADVRKKNEEASAALDIMKKVVAENRLKLEAMNAQYKQGAISEVAYRRQLAIAQEDRQKMLSTAEQTTKQANVFAASEQQYKSENPDVDTTDLHDQIVNLGTRASSMTQIATTLADGRLG